MLDNQPENIRGLNGHINLAWPSGLLLAPDGTGEVYGVLMPRVAGIHIAELYNLKSRLLVSPSFHWRYLVRAALNLSVTFDRLHAKAYVVGDVNETNAFVAPTAELSLVDTDSFQVVDPQTKLVFRCPVGTPNFTPPANRWASALGRFETSLRTCKNPNHVYGAHLAECPWCSRTKVLNGRDPFPSPEAIKERRHLLRPVPKRHHAPAASVSTPSAPVPSPSTSVSASGAPPSARSSSSVADMAIRFAVVATAIVGLLAGGGAMSPEPAVLAVLAAAGLGALIAVARDSARTSAQIPLPVTSGRP